MPTKLADNYVPSMHKIKDNDIYGKYQVEIDHALRAPSEIEASRERVTEHSYEYKLAEEEIEFYNELYVPTGSPQSDQDPNLVKYFGDSLINKQQFVGENDKDLLDFLETKSGVLVLVAPVGWGKTALIRNVFFNLAPQSEYFKSKVIPIYFSLEQNENTFEGLRSSRTIKNELYRLLLKNRLLNISVPFASVSNIDLWDYLTEDCNEFAYLKQKIIDITEIHKSKPKKIAKKKSKLFSQARENDNYPFLLAKYISQKKNKIPVIIFDNVDSFSLQFQEAIVKEAINLSENYSLKVIISMRKITYDRLAEDPQGLFATFPIAKVFMAENGLNAYINKRTSLAIRKISLKELAIVDPVGKRITTKNTHTTMTSMLKLLFNNDIVHILDNLAYHNKRRVNTFLKRYLVSGYIDTAKLIYEQVKEEIEVGTDYESPFWVLLSSILTANYATHFSTNCPDSEVLRSIINVYCNCNKGINDHFIRLHILNFFERNNKTSFEHIYSIYKSMFEESNSTLIKNCLSRAIKRFLECNLIVSPEYYKLSNNYPVSRLKVLEFTSTGHFYRKALSAYFEYLIYLKDDVHLKDDTKIKDCIRATHRIDRYNEVFSFLEFLFSEEDQFLRSLSGSKRKIFLKNFSIYENNIPYMSHLPINMMIKFGEDRKLPQTLVNKFTALQKMILENSESIK